MARGKFISYLRVTTEKQGRSGLGIEAQRKAVADFLNGGNWKLIAEFVEEESGKLNDRPELKKALAACRAHGATLVVAKLDRLGRKAAFIFHLLEDARVKFHFVDLPEATPEMIGLYAIMAESEGRRISERTKAALAAAKARGTKLGRPENLKDEHRRIGSRRGVEARARAAAERAADLAPIVGEIQSDEPKSLRYIAAELDRRGISAPRGGAWSAMQVQRLLARL
jgi:DNA invertase Pin-like site-specific DNA recombinase